jgi:hypothetical protein
MKKSGFYFIEAMPKGTARFANDSQKDGRNPEPGTSMPEGWTPYKVWSGDLWECEGCHTQIVHGTGNNRIAEHYEDGFAETIERLGADQLQVNDC